MRHPFKSHLLLSSALILAVPSAASFAQEDGLADIDEIQVIGSRLRAQQDIAQKFDEDIVFDSLSQDDISTVPDFNVADAFRRIPGVAAEFDEDEGRFINIRGIDANLNFVAFDGLGVPSTGAFGGSGRNVNVEFFPTTAVKRLEVRKTFTPDIDGSSIGGYVNVLTRSAFDSEGASFTGKVTGSHFTLTEIEGDNRLPIRVEGTFSTTFGSQDEFGFVLTGLFSQRPRDQDRLFTVGGIENTFDGFVPPTRFDTSLTGNDQERYGANGRLEYRNDNSYGFVAGYFYRQQEDEVRFRNNLRLSAGDVTQTGPNEGVLADARMELNFDYFPIRTQGKGVQAHYETEVLSGKLDIDVGWAEQNFDHDTPALVFRTGFVPELGVTINDSDLIPTRSTVNDPAYLADPNNYALSFIRERDLNTDEKMFNAVIDYGWNNESSDRGLGFKTGLAFRNLDRVRDNEEFRFSGVDLSTVATLGPLVSSNSNFISDFQPDPFIFYDVGATLALFDSLDIPRDVGRSTSPDFNYDENIYAAYGMGTYRTDRFTALFGVRYERTRFQSGAQDQPEAVDGNFDNFLPSVNLKYEVMDSVFLRGAYSRTLGRPNPGDLTVTTIVTDSTETNSGLTEIRRGNPDLRPRVSDNYDLSLEYYFNEGEGLLSAAVFLKDIGGDIFFTEEQGTLNGEPVIFRQNTNSAGSQVKGLELQAYMGSLPMLPAPFNGLGFSANATFLDGETELLDGTVLDRRIRQADFLANVSVFYTTDSFEARLAYNYTDDFLIRSNREDDKFQQVDASMRYYYGDNIVLSVEGRNLTDSRRRQITGSNFDQLFGVTRIGRQFHFGLTYTY